MDLFITVKKSDGSQVRMTMEEFKLYKQNLQNKNNQSVVQTDEKKEQNLEKTEEIIQPINQSVVQSVDDEEELFSELTEAKSSVSEEKPNSENLPMIETTHSLSNVAPVKDIFLDEAAYQEKQKSRKTENKVNLVSANIIGKKIKKSVSDPAGDIPRWNENDHLSLLEEDDSEVKKNRLYTTLPVSNDELVDKIISEIDFPFSDDLLGRLRSLTLSRIKDIRTDDQILEYAMREKESGGLSFSQVEADQLVQLIKQHFNGRYKKEKLTKSEISSAQKVITEDILPTVKQSHLTTKIGTGKPVLHDVIFPSKIKSDLPSQDSSVVNDKKSVGPLDELRTFDLKDWRRLSNNPAKAGEELLEKFIVMKKESFLNFMEAVTAWRQSPLYNMYKAIIADCISKQQKVTDYLFNQDKNNILSSEEFDELVKVNKNLV